MLSPVYSCSPVYPQGLVVRASARDSLSCSLRFYHLPQARVLPPALQLTAFRERPVYPQGLVCRNLSATVCAHVLQKKSKVSATLLEPA